MVFKIRGSIKCTFEKWNFCQSKVNNLKEHKYVTKGKMIKEKLDSLLKNLNFNRKIFFKLVRLSFKA